MSSKKKNLSEYDLENVPGAENMKMGIVVSEWHPEVTGALLEGAVSTLKKHGCSDDNIIIRWVPGSFELTLAAKFFADHTFVDAVIVLCCVIQGETRHFNYICQSIIQGITQLNLKYGMPFTFGVLTTDTLQQAIDRSGGKYGNKGIETAIAAIKMVALQNSF
ncbi:MAG: 6,7-dimethyl-8-ribityllumazine synthase [Bacteroidia bacterium]|nr:6,7-dimethyl-8-ribityllumazine synthase [Bacteroidia bacterium]